MFSFGFLGCGCFWSVCLRWIFHWPKCMRYETGKFPCKGKMLFNVFLPAAEEPACRFKTMLTLHFILRQRRGMFILWSASLTHIVETRALHNCVTEWVSAGHGLIMHMCKKKTKKNMWAVTSIQIVYTINYVSVL